MKIETPVDEAMLRAAAEYAVAQLFRVGNDRYNPGGDGYQIIARQAAQWAKAQDWTPLIAEVAPAIIREAIHEATRAAIEAEIRKAAKRMRESGEFKDLGL